MSQIDRHLYMFLGILNYKMNLILAELYKSEHGTKEAMLAELIRDERESLEKEFEENFKNSVDF